MYLKRIELFGFKSFADRTELEFVPGVTAVVGPNGSGKSNVSDSVRWVLGEQSAKSLRGAKMEDIIFSGSESRRSLNYGEVSLTLDNTDGILPLDYSEVTVTRRVYRSGESEFLINKQACRLKDITELFMDTGLGREAYSIIGQGRIEAILSTKPEDRRGILEEAAGIVKYKSRKREAVRKLEETETNLVRIQDIMSEIDVQLEPLAKQAEKAKQYKEWRDELTGKEIATYVYILEKLHEDWTKINSVIEGLKHEEADLSFQVNEQEVHIEKLKWSIHQEENKLDNWHAKLLHLTEELEKLEGQKGVLIERKKNFSTNQEDLQAKLTILSERQSKLTNEEALEVKKLENIKRAVAVTESQLATALEQYHHLHPDLEERIEDIKGDYIELLNKQAAINNELRFHEQTINQVAQKLTSLATENRRFIHERAEANQNLAVQKEFLEQLNNELQQKQALLKELLHKQEAAQKLLQQKEEKLRNYHQQVDKLNHRLTFLVEMKEDFSGFFQGVKEILKARHSLSGIHGAVAELIQVPKTYQLAIEIALGASLQHVVVEDEEAGRRAIQFLKQKNLGRATFLPLPVIRPKHIPPNDAQLLGKVDGVVGVALDLIQSKPEYKNLLSNLLGQVIVTTNLKMANQLAKQLGYRYRFVTLEGDVVNPGGSMTGGSVRQNSSNLLGREHEIEHLEKEMTKGKLAIEQLTVEVNKDHEHIRQLNEQIAICQSEEEKLKERELSERTQLAHYQYAQQRVDERLEVYDQEAHSLQTEHEESLKKQQASREKLATISLQITKLEENIKILEQQKEQTVSSRAEKNEEITHLKVKLAREMQELEELERIVKRVAENKQEMASEWKETYQLLQRLTGDMAAQHTLETDLDDAIEAKKQEREELAKYISDTREKRRSQQQQSEEIDMKLRNLRLEHKKLEEHIHKQEVKANRLDVELENYLTLLREEYELSYELAKERYPLPAPYEQVKAEVDKLKRAIQLLGEVNLGSIEEHLRLTERYQFLHEQEADLQEAKHSLYEIIAEMDEIMTQRFEETYTAVRQEFQLVFQELFGGGRADMILSEPDNLLTTGIDIIAEPPGKKLQHLGLLSGGERALTAIAILFAILRVKPVPFCILDEVEAALDDANVHRFAAFLKEFSKQTQFIVITHRKGTMEGADVLYGITMQESGVSKLVSVKLEENEEFISA